MGGLDAGRGQIQQQQHVPKLNPLLGLSSTSWVHVTVLQAYVPCDSGGLWKLTTIPMADAMLRRIGLSVCYALSL